MVSDPTSLAPCGRDQGVLASCGLSEDRNFPREDDHAVRSSERDASSASAFDPLPLMSEDE